MAMQKPPRHMSSSTSKPTNAPPEPGLGDGPGAFGDGGDNVKGSAGNAQLSGTNNPGSHALPNAGK